MVAALKMMRCQAYPLAIIGSVLAMLVSPGNLIGLPIGIWALVTLTQRDVKRSFSRVATRHLNCDERFVWAPSACLFVVAGISLVTVLGFAIWFGPARLFSALLALHALFLASAATVMLRLRARRYALFAMISAGLLLPMAIGLPPLALLPAMVPLWLGMPATIWAVAILFRPEVREAFASTSRKRLAQAAQVGVAAHGNVKREADGVIVQAAPVAATPASHLENPSDEDLIVGALRRSKNKIQAIRLYRELTGAGLVAAKAAVEAIAQTHDIELKTLTPGERAWQIAIASLLLIAAIFLAGASAISDGAKVGTIVGGSLLYVAFVAAHGIGARKDAIRGNISVPWRRCANTHAWVVVLGLLGVASGLLPWGRISWYGPDTTGAPDAPSRWNAQALYGWRAWEGKAVMAIFLVLALLRLTSGFAIRPKRRQAASLIVGAAGVLTLCYLSTQDRITPQLPTLVLNLVRVEFQPGLAVPVALAVALLVVAAVEWRVAREESGKTLPLAAILLL